MKPSEDPPKIDYSVIRGMDPSASWLLGPGSHCFLPDGEQTLVPFILKPAERIATLDALLKTDPDFYIAPSQQEILDAGGHATALARRGFFDRVATQEDEVYLSFRSEAKDILLCSAQDTAALPALGTRYETYPQVKPPELGPPQGGWLPGTVVMGIIDDGIAFAHERFRSAETETRVQCFWHQDGTWDEHQSVESGREICKTDQLRVRPDGSTFIQDGIDTLLNDSTFAGSVDEDDVYRKSGLIDFRDDKQKSAAWRASHGTHVLDLAAGKDMSKQELARPIVAVQLQSAVTADTSGATLLNKLLEAIVYIVNRADALAGSGKKLPVVINFSYGLIAGPHDGRSLIELAFELVMALRAPDEPPIRIVLPSGNSHLSRCHAAVTFPSFTADESLGWRVQPDDRTCSMLEVWMPRSAFPGPDQSRMRLSVTSPSGVQTASLGEVHGTGVHILDDNNQIVCRVDYHYAFLSQKGCFRVYLQPTARLEPATSPPLAEAGLWMLTLENQALEAEETVHLWVQRDDTPFGYRVRGRQSYFDDPRYVRFDPQGREIVDEEDLPPGTTGGPVTRKSLINAIATGRNTIVAGGYRSKSWKAAPYSAGGPTVPAEPDERRKPDALMASDDSKVHAGVFGAGSRSGSIIASNGTSAAAPLLARVVASQLAGNLAGNRATVRDEAEAQDLAPPTKPDPPADRAGWGRIFEGAGLPVHKIKRFDRDD